MIVAVAAVLALGVIITPAGAETFANNLTFGSRGTEVVALQQFLVSKGFLEMPIGVPYGYFGPLTRGAVARWQASSGIAPAVGYFGPISRSAIATQMSPAGSSISTTSTSSPAISVSSGFVPSIDTPTALGMRANRVMLFRAFPFEVRTGEAITLDGSGFSKTSNQVYFNGGYPVTATSTNGTDLEIFVPAVLSESEYKLSVSNMLGSSENPEISIIIKVTHDPQPAPIIESASIVGDMVTLIGSGFTSANNLFTTLGDSSGSMSSNGNTLIFRITDLSRYSQTRQFTQGRYQAALWIFVQNEHGINKEPYKLEIII